MRLSFSIATRFLKSNILQTIIIILGIGVGVSVQIFIGSLIQGLQKSLIDTTIGNSAHITITSSSETYIENYQQTISDVKGIDNRVRFISPVFDNAAFLSVDDNSQSLLVRGFDFTEADKIYKINNYLVEGRIPDSENEIIIGSALKDEYNINLNDQITLITPSRTTVECKVVGFFDFKVAQLNENWCLTTLSNSQMIFDTNDVVSSIEIQISPDNIFDADEVADGISKVIDLQDLEIKTWKQQNEQLLSGLQGQSVSSLMIQIFVMISVVLGIASVLAITVMQKSKQIGILKAMGIKNSKASFIFLNEGLILGIFGAIVGIALGIGLAFVFTTFALRPDGSPVVALYIDYNFIALSGIIAVIACLVASLIPARRSSMLNPIDIIRNN